jgi:excisionase family DNA binding protein
MRQAQTTRASGMGYAPDPSESRGRQRLIKVYPDLAEALSISRSKAFDLCASGEVRTVRFGRAVRVPIEEVERVIAERLTGNAA